MRKVATKAILVSLISVFSLTSCNTTTKLIRHGTLEVQTKMSSTVFLDPIADNKKTVYLQIRNTTGKSILAIESKIKTAVQSKGYSIVTNPDTANIMIQANILQVGKSNLEDPFQVLPGGYGSSLAGFGIGAALGGALGSSGQGMLGAGLFSGAANTILDAAVEVVNFTMITDLQVSERTTHSKNNWNKHQTRIVSIAKKTNLKFEEAAPELVSGLVNSIVGVL